MRLDYAKAHPTTQTKFTVVAVTGAFLGRLTKELTEAELELSVMKNRIHRGGDVNYLHDYTDANQCLLDAIEQVFPETAEDGVDLQDPFVSSLIDKVWAHANATLASVYQ